MPVSYYLVNSVCCAKRYCPGACFAISCALDGDSPSSFNGGPQVFRINGSPFAFSINDGLSVRYLFTTINLAIRALHFASQTSFRVCFSL